MNYIDLLSQKNIQFNDINEVSAQRIMEKEYPCYRFLEYLSLFGNYYCLDFSHLYYMTTLDEKLRHIIICKCLELEQALKTIVIHDVDTLGNKDFILKEYIDMDKAFLESRYVIENLDVSYSDMDSFSLDKTSFEHFLDIAQFGTFERFLCFFYKENSMALYHKKTAPFMHYIDSIKHLRNLCAHNGSFFISLSKKRKVTSERVSSFLGAHGIKHKSLRTNLSKQVVFDLCNLIHLCCLVLPYNKTIDTLDQFRDYTKNDCVHFMEYYSNNSSLVSLYSFLNSVLDIYVDYTSISKQNS